NAQAGHPTLIYPTGWGFPGDAAVTIEDFGRKYGIVEPARKFAADHGVPFDKKIWIPGSLMSFRDVVGMLMCLFYVNDLPGGEGQHDGGMKGRDPQAVLGTPLMTLTADETAALDALSRQPKRTVITEARPEKGTPNLTLTDSDIKDVALPGPEKPVTPRAGSEAAYLAVAKKYPKQMFVVSADLNPSTRLEKAVKLLPETNHFEMSIEEQAATLLTDGLSFSSHQPQLNVFSTFGAFLEGIAREGFEMWRYQRNLTGYNEGLNVVMHFAHVGAGFGGHIVAIPRDNLPVLTRADGKTPLWHAGDAWTSVTPSRTRDGAKSAILTVGAPSYLAVEASEKAAARGVPVDVIVVNGFPMDEEFLDGLPRKYTRIMTLEDGLIGTKEAGLRGFAAFLAGRLAGCGVTLDHQGITDPRIAPSETFQEVWAHYGMTADALAERLTSA